MANKLLVFLGLADGDETVIEAPRNKQRGDYMKKIQRLVIDDEEPHVTPEDERPERPVIPVPEVPVQPVPSAETVTSEPAPEPVPVAVENTEPEENEKRAPRHSAKEPGKTFGSRLFGGGSTSRKAAEPQLVLIRKNILEMTDDVEEALSSGQTVLLDFSNEDFKKAKQAVARVVNFVRVHNGAFYTVTKTSLLVTMDKNAIVEWLPEENGEK